MWEHAGIVCTGETYKAVVKLTFAKGAALEDPTGLFNFSLEGNVRRAIDIHEGDKIDAKALKALIRAAVATDRARLLRCHVKSQGTKPQRCPFFAGIPCWSPRLVPPLQRPAAEPARARHMIRRSITRDTDAKACRSSSLREPLASVAAPPPPPTRCRWQDPPSLPTMA